MTYGRTRRPWAARVLAAAALVVASIAVVPSAPAQATLAGFKSVQHGTAWVDFNNDGKTDYCSTHGTGLKCALSTGTAFGQVITVSNLSNGQGQDNGRAWTDFNGDGRADYCRVVDAGGTALSCTLSNGTSFGATYTSGKLDAGWSAGGRAWADFNGDGRADYCRVIGTWSQKVQCTLSTGTGFGATYTSGSLDAGWNSGRAWVDANGDGKADYCRTVGYEYLRCTLSTGTGFGSSFTSVKLDAGWDYTQHWADFNGDGRADFCRNTGNDVTDPVRARCTLSLGNSFGATINSPQLDEGVPGSQRWADINGDGRDDFCRITKNEVGICTISMGNSFDAWYSHPSVFSYGGWVDLNGDGLADHGTIRDQVTTFTLSTGTGWSASLTSPRPF